MNRNRLSLFSLVLIVLVLTSCSGLPKAAGGGGGGGVGNGLATIVLTMTAEAQSDQTKFTILAFSAQITSLTLNKSLGGTTNVPLPTTPYPVDFNRLNTDSASLGSFQVASDTVFASMSMALSNVTLTIAIPPTATAIGTCQPGSVCEITVAPQLANIVANSFPAKFTAQTVNGITLSVRPQDIVTVTNGILTVDFSGTNFVPSIALPRVNQAANTLDSVEDFTGKVTAISNSSITVTNGLANGSSVLNGVPFTAKLGSESFDDDSPLPGCAAKNISCVKLGSVVSLDAVVNSLDGTVTATEVDLLDPVAVDSIEGTIFSTGGGNFSLVLTDKQVASTNATLIAANIGDIFSIGNLNGAGTFTVDTKNLSTATPAVPVNLFQGTGDILNGQTVRLHVSAATGTMPAGDQTATPTSVQLRFTRFSAFKSNAAAGLLTITSLGAFYQAPNLAVVQTYPVTVLDKFTDLTTVGVAPGTSFLISTRALFLKAQNNFYATKIRDQ